MNDPIFNTSYPYRTQSASASTASTRAAQPQTGETVESFQQALAAIVMGMGMSGMEGESNGMAMPMMTMMMALLEKMLAGQVEDANQQTAESASSAFSAVDPYAAYTVETGYESGGGRIDPLAFESGGGRLPFSTDHAEPSGRPVEGRISQRSHAGHVALDIAVPVGTPVRSTMQGKVVYAGWNTQGYGNLVIVENGPYRTYYAHLSEIPVRVGDPVDYQTVIGLSGSTGNSTGPHLHYEIRKNMVHIDPTTPTLNTA